MKNLVKNKKLMVAVIMVILIVVVSGILLLTKNNDNNSEKTQETLYTMYVKINPLVKLTFKEIEYKCDEPTGTCTKIDGIVDYELLNDDAKDIYKDVDFKDKGVYEIVGMLCKIARDNGIAFKSIGITTDYKFNYDDFVKEMKDNSKYEVDYEITLDIKELIDEQEIINEDIESYPNIKSYTVTFDSNGGNDITKQVVKENDKVNEPSNPTRTGYKFVEWQLNGEKYDFNSKVIEDITLKAKWEKDTSSNKPNENNKQNTSNNNDNNNNKETPSEDTSNNKETPSEDTSNNKEEDHSNDGIVISNNTITYNGTYLMSFPTVKTTYMLDPDFIITPKYDSNAIKNLPSDIKKELLGKFCEATRGQCSYNIVTGLNEPYYYRHWRDESEGGQGGLNWIRRQINEYRSTIEFGNKCISYLETGVADSSWDTSDPGICYKDQGYTIESFKRVNETTEQYISWAEHDIPIYEKSNSDFKAIIDLLK